MLEASRCGNQRLWSNADVKGSPGSAAGRRIASAFLLAADALRASRTHLIALDAPLFAIQASRLDLGIASSVSLSGRVAATAADTAIVAANG